MATDKEYKAVIDALSGECERLHKENVELKKALENHDTFMKYAYSQGKQDALSQEPESGKWIEQEGWDGDVYYECSVCGEPFCLIDGTPTDNMYNYCPNCGAKMEGEDKE